LKYKHIISFEYHKCHSLKYFRMILLSSSLFACSTLDSTVEDPVAWWAVNGWGGNVTIELYDNNCKRYLQDIRFSGNEEVRIVSCGDGNGQANVRYRREGYASRMPSWSPDALLRSDQRAIVR
jgi:hypothetical protein